MLFELLLLEDQGDEYSAHLTEMRHLERLIDMRNSNALLHTQHHRHLTKIAISCPTFYFSNFIYLQILVPASIRTMTNFVVGQGEYWNLRSRRAAF